MIEDWRCISGFPQYWISDQGRVLSFVSREPRILKPGTDHKGKLYVYLGRKERKFIHHLVLEEFVCARPEGLHACHKNDWGDDNRLSNLEWGTPAHNREQSRINGGMCVGSKHPHARLTEQVVAEARLLHEKDHVSIAALARMFKVHAGTMKQAIRRETWKHVV